MSQFHKIDYLHQIIIIDSMDIPDRLSPTIMDNVNAAKRLYPAAHHKIWSGNDLRAMIGERFEPEVLAAFDTLIPYSFKCDLARYCLMYAFGGIYFDIALKLVNAWDIPLQYGAAAFTEMYPGMESWTCTQTSLLWSLPGRPEWKYCIDNIVQNCREFYYGPHDHYPTAGALLGRAFADTVNNRDAGDYLDDQFMGEVRYITPERQQQNCTFISPHRKLVGMRTKLIAGALSEFALPGTNSYVEQYRKRRIYHNEQELVWNLNDLRFDIEQRAVLTYTGARPLKGAVGRIMYGPYVPLSPGLHKIVFFFSPDTQFSKIYVDIVGNKASTLISEIDCSYPKPRSMTQLVHYFRVEAEFDDVEFRLSVFGDFSGELQSIRIFEEWLLSDDEKKVDPAVVFSSTGLDGQMRFRKNRNGRPNTIGRVNGISMSGPYVTLEPGEYEATVALSDVAQLGTITLEVCSNAGDKLLFSERLDKPTDGRITKTIPLSLPRRERDVEIRARTTLLSSAVVDSLKISKM